MLACSIVGGSLCGLTGKQKCWLCCSVVVVWEREQLLACNGIRSLRDLRGPMHEPHRSFFDMSVKE